MATTGTAEARVCAALDEISARLKSIAESLAVLVKLQKDEQGRRAAGK